MKILRYRELKNLKTFEERFDYLKLVGKVGEASFGFDRYINQRLYHSREWQSARRDVIVRDGACDLGIPGREIYGDILVHHLNPMTLEDIKKGNEDIFNPEFLICTTQRTHRAIHYGDKRQLAIAPIARMPNDTIPWRRKEHDGR